MANNINQIRATIEANLKKISAVYYSELAASTTVESAATARANYAAALREVKLNTDILINDQIKPTIADLAFQNSIFKMGRSTSVVLLEGELKDNPPKPTQIDICVQLFNDYVKELQKLLDETGYSNIGIIKGIGEYISGKEDGDNPVDCWLACEVTERLKESNYDGPFERGFFENCRDFIKRLNLPPALRNPVFGLPSFPIELLPGYIGDHPPTLTPEVFEEQEEKIKEYLRQIRDNPSGNQPRTACAKLYKEAVEWLSKRLKYGLKLTKICKKLKEIMDLLKANDCILTLNLDVLFGQRNIGRFDNLDAFQTWWWDWFMNPFSFPNLKPYYSSLTPEQYDNLSDFLAYRDRPDRYEVALKKYEEWENLPESNRSITPPIWKDTFAMFDDTDFDDEMVFRYFTSMVFNGQYDKITCGWQETEMTDLNTALTDLLKYYAEG